MLSRHAVDGTFLFASPAAAIVFGRTPAQLVGTALTSHAISDDADLLARALAQALTSEDAVVTRVRLAGDAPARTVEVVTHAVRDASGQPTELHCITRDLADELAAAAAAAASAEFSQRLQTMLANVPGVVWASWRSAGGPFASFVSENIISMIGYPPEAWRTDPEFWLTIAHPDDRAHMAAHGGDVFAKGHDILRFRWIHRDGHPVWIEANLSVLRDTAGQVIGLCGVNMDITDRKTAETAEAALRDELLATQERVLAELSTPLIPISADVVAMPLIGALDGQRASRVVDTLLHGVASSRARVAILDITGVTNMDTRTADALVRAARGVALLGARVVLTGIRPEVAQTLVSLGTDLGDIVTLNTLEAGIRFAMQRPR